MALKSKIAKPKSAKPTQAPLAAPVDAPCAPPRARVVHSDPGAPATAEQQPLPNAFIERGVDQKSPAEWMYDRIILYIRNFEQQLDAAHEIAMGFAGGDAGVLRIEGVGYFDPDVVTFYGRDEAGGKTQLIQHVAQVSVILRAVRKVEPDAPARRIGFRLATGWAGGESGDASV
jgi:Family of unknown function (DUF6173)